MKYKFKHIFEFIRIIHESVLSGVGFWGFNPNIFVDRATKFNKDTLLHLYIVCQLMNHYSRLYRKNSYYYFEDKDIVEFWLELFDEYKVDYMEDEAISEDSTIYSWFENNFDCFEELFDKLAQEMFYFLFMDKLFLAEFNKLVQTLINKKEEHSLYELHFEENKIDKNGHIKRCSIPKWVRIAVYHRDKGRCVFCGKDLTNIVTKLNNANYDHIIPLADGGANDPCNIQLSCETCNKTKWKFVQIPNYDYEPWF